jgi:hypothetical protein
MDVRSPPVNAPAGQESAVLGVPIAVERQAQTSPAAECSGLDAWSVATADFKLSLIGATLAPKFTGPFHLGKLEDGRNWLIVAYQFHNATGSDFKVDQGIAQILSGGELLISQDKDASKAVVEALGADAPPITLEGGEQLVIVQVFKVDSTKKDNSLTVIANGNWHLNLRPVTDAADGKPEAVISETAPDLAKLTVPEEEIKAAPTPAPSPTPVPTDTPAPAELGSDSLPASIGDVVVVDGLGVQVERIEIIDSLDGGFDEPKGGYRCVIVTVQMLNASDGSKDYGEGDFTASDAQRGWDVD